MWQELCSFTNSDLRIKSAALVNRISPTASWQGKPWCSLFLLNVSILERYTQYVVVVVVVVVMLMSHFASLLWSHIPYAFYFYLFLYMDFYQAWSKHCPPQHLCLKKESNSVVTVQFAKENIKIIYSFTKMNSECLKTRMTFKGVPENLKWSDAFLILKMKRQDSYRPSVLYLNLKKSNIAKIKSWSLKGDSMTIIQIRSLTLSKNGKMLSSLQHMEYRDEQMK